MDSITHIVDGEKVLNEYEYDAWGEVVSQKKQFQMLMVAQSLGGI